MEEEVISFCYSLALQYFVFKDAKLWKKDGGLQGVQPAVHAHADVVVATVLPVAGNLPHHFGEFVVIGEDGASVAVAAQRLAGKEAGAGDGGEVAAFAAFVAGAKALGCVFNNGDAVPGGNGVDGVEVCALAIQAYRDDSLGARGDRGFQQGRVEVVVAGVDVYIHRVGPQQGHGFGRGNVGEAGGDDFVARADAQRHLGDLQRVGAVGHADAVAGAGVGRELFFQFGHFRAQDVLAVVQHALDASIDFNFKKLILGI